MEENKESAEKALEFMNFMSGSDDDIYLGFVESDPFPKTKDKQLLEYLLDCIDDIYANFPEEEKKVHGMRDITETIEYDEIYVPEGDYICTIKMFADELRKRYDIPKRKHSVEE